MLYRINCDRIEKCIKNVIKLKEEQTEKSPIAVRRKQRKYDVLLSAVGEMFRRQFALDRLSMTEIGKTAGITYQFVSKLCNGDQVSEVALVKITRAIPIASRLEILKRVFIDPIAGVKELPLTRSDLKVLKEWLRAIEKELDAG